MYLERDMQDIEAKLEIIWLTIQPISVTLLKQHSSVIPLVRFRALIPLSPRNFIFHWKSILLQPSRRKADSVFMSLPPPSFTNGA